MIHRPADVVTIKAKRRGNGHGGWSKNNPYIEDVSTSAGLWGRKHISFSDHCRKRFVEFEIDIDPPALVSRIVSVRDQIAKEWIVDLDTLVKANEMIIESYIETSVSNRAEECEENGIPEDCLDSESLHVPNSSQSEAKKGAYERLAMTFLANSIANMDRGSSPHRKGNFDLLVLLATQEAIHRILREYRDDESRQVSFAWLRDFYVDRVASHFDGNQGYGRADDFLEELLLTVPSFKTTGDAVEVIDPLRVAEDIICMRTAVANEWKTTMFETPKDHTSLQRLVLDVRMGKNLEQERKEGELASDKTEAVYAEDNTFVADLFNNLDEAGAFE